MKPLPQPSREPRALDLARGLGLLSFLCAIVLLVDVASAAGAGERVVLDSLVEAERLVLELDNAEIHIFLEGDHGALLRAAVPADSPAPEALELVREKGSARVVRPLPVVEDGPRLRVDLLASPRMPLRIAGRDLRIRIEPALLGDSAKTNTGTKTPPPAAATGEQADSVPLLEIDLEASELMAQGIRDISGKAQGSTLTLVDTLDSIRLALLESTTEIEGHQGLVELQIIGGETDVKAAEGSHQLWAATNAQIRIGEGRGRLQAQLTNLSRLRLDDFRGDIAIEGARSFLEGRRLWSAGGKGIELEGEAFDFVLEDCRGPFEARLRGGRLSGTAFLGEVEITGLGGAGIELEDMSGRLALWLRDGSAGTVAEMRGRLEANVENAKLEVQDTQRLDLTAKDAEIGLRGLRAIAGFRAQGSRLDLDLRSLRGSNPKLHLLSGTHGAIRLAAPCMVQISTPGGTPSGHQNVEILGCETRRVGVSEPGSAPQRIDGARRTLLTLDIAPDAQIEIEGR